MFKKSVSPVYFYDPANVEITGGTATLSTLSVTSTVSLGGVAGAESAKIIKVNNAVNRIEASGSITTSPVVIGAAGDDTNIDIHFLPKGNGVLRFGDFNSAILPVVTGYVTIKTTDGTTRKLAVIA